MHVKKFFFCFIADELKILTQISLVSFLRDIDKQYSPRCDAAERGHLGLFCLHR